MESSFTKEEKDFRLRGVFLGSAALFGAFFLDLNNHNIAAFLTAIYGIATTGFNGAHYLIIESIENPPKQEEII